MSYFFDADAPRSPAATLTTRYGSSSACTSSSSIASRRSCSSYERGRVAVDEQLDLVELVHAEHALRVLAGGARLAAEARRERGVAQRQLVQDLAHVEARERDLGRAGEVEVVGLERVDVRLLGREEAGAVHRPFAHEHRRQHRHVAVLRGAVEREAVDRERDERRVADEVAEARARDARGALHLEAADLRVLGAVGLRVADAPELDRVVVGVAVGSGRIRGVGNDVEQRVAVGLGGRELVLGGRAARP